MALDKAGIQLLVEMRAQSLVGGGATPTVLEFGEQNWYGDVAPEEIHALVDRFRAATPERQKLHAELDQCLSAKGPNWTYEVAKIFYRALLDYREYTAIDLHGTERALRHDLNTPLALGRQFHLVTNLGTAEHVFNQYQFFRSVHEHTAPGALMLHWLPNQGWFDHGFYSYHPTFIFDLCHANGYQLLACLLAGAGQTKQVFTREDYVQLAVRGELDAGRSNALLVALRKGAPDAPFRIPQQGYYDNRLSPELREAWHKISRS